LSFLARLDRRPHVRRIQEMVRRYVAEDIVRDSPAERPKRETELLDCLCGLRVIPIPPDIQGMVAPPRPRQTLDVSDFEKRSSNMVNQASTAVAKSASVFSEALEMATDAADNYSPAASRALMKLMPHFLSEGHAFDEGEPDALEFVRKQRAQALAELSFFPGLRRPKELEEMSSADSPEIQAADIAAGIARELWYRAGLVNLLRHFDDVLLNGMRLSEKSAASHPYSRPPLQ
jgi:hypothetical protein